MEKPDFKAFSINCKGDACVGDEVLFERRVYVGEYSRYEKPIFSHKEKVVAKLTKDSYGAKKQQHTFSIKISWISAEGYMDKTTTIKGRNLYRLGTKRKPWEDEKARSAILADKHARGTKARKDRIVRRGY